MSSTQENKAMRDYLDLCKDWFFDLYAVHGVEFDEIHQALVHYREPWVSASKLQSALKRWKLKQQPQPWPLHQPQRTPGFRIPPPPDVLGVISMRLMPNVGHLSLPARPHLAHPDPRLHHSEPRNFMQTSMIGHGMAMASAYPQVGLSSQYNALQGQQQHELYQAQKSTAANSMASSDILHNSAYQPTSQVIPAETQGNPSSQLAEDDSEEDTDCEPKTGSVCGDCKLIIGDKCECSHYG